MKTTKELADAWRALQMAAMAFAKSTTSNTETAKALSDAALAYAAARGNMKVERPKTADNDPVLRFGRSKGKTVSEAATDDLEWMLERVRESIDDPERARFRRENEALVAAIEAELEARS